MGREPSFYYSSTAHIVYKGSFTLSTLAPRPQFTLYAKVHLLFQNDKFVCWAASIAFGKVQLSYLPLSKINLEILLMYSYALKGR